MAKKNKNWNEKRQNRLNELEAKHPGDITDREKRELARLRELKQNG
jgi:hypothetical protein